MVTDIVSWASTAHGLTGCPIELGNQTAATVLLIRNGDGAWALTYGMGFQLLDHDQLDPGFGQRVAIRTADANALNSLTRTTLDQPPPGLARMLRRYRRQYAASTQDRPERVAASDAGNAPAEGRSCAGSAVRCQWPFGRSGEREGPKVIPEPLHALTVHNTRIPDEDRIFAFPIHLEESRTTKSPIPPNITTTRPDGIPY